MANYNRVIMIGNLTRDPQLSYLPSSTPVVEFGLASNRRWRGQDGQMKEDTCFVDCRCYGKPAETINQYVSKGRQLMVEGRLQFQQWTTQDGNKRSKHIIVVDAFQFLDGGGGRRGDTAAGPRQESAEPAAPAPDDHAPAPDDHAPAPADSDIPF